MKYKILLTDVRTSIGRLKLIWTAADSRILQVKSEIQRNLLPLIFFVNYGDLS